MPEISINRTRHSHRGALPSLLLAVAVVMGLTSPSAADVVTLYDGPTQQDTPDNVTPQFLTYFSQGGGSQNFDSGKDATQLDTSVNPTTNAGYTNYELDGSAINGDFPSLIRADGYTLKFSVEIITETHSPDDLRAGFSVILISDDVNPGVLSSVEIGIQNDRVFSQSGGSNPFQSADEEAAFDPIGQGFIDYALTVQDDAYEFRADGDLLLSGNLKDYTAFEGPIDPYETGSFVFFGDDTTSASGDIYFRSATITTHAVPEAAPLPLLLAGGVLLLVVAWRRRRLAKRVVI